MKNIEATIVADSIFQGQRITSFLCTYPRFIHSEIMTHRMLSRNAASSRAIPSAKVIEAVSLNPAMPEWWGKNQSGMQAKEQIIAPDLGHAKGQWLWCRDQAIIAAEEMKHYGLHKQIANRVLEPWFHITVLITATCWDNFFKLRAQEDAQPEFQVLAYRMLNQFLKQCPTEMDEGEWHLPFDPGHDPSWSMKHRIAHSVVSAARTSYVKMDKEADLKADWALYERLSESGHWSPFEHQARANSEVTQSGNFRGPWEQHRTMFGGENPKDVDLWEILGAKPDWVQL